MYHSEAILLADGRILISGSDPQDQPNPERKPNPQEYRIEVYYPPYLVDGRVQPQITALPVTDWAYGGRFTITVRVFQTGPIRFSLLGSVASTHGSSMGIRTIFPEVTPIQSFYPHRLTIYTVFLQWKYVHHRCSAKCTRLPVSYYHLLCNQ